MLGIGAAGHVIAMSQLCRIIVEGAGSRLARGSEVRASRIECFKRFEAAKRGQGFAMSSRKVIFWEVDTQADFMLPGGKLYVPGAERLLPNIRKLTDAARDGRVFLVSRSE